MSVLLLGLTVTVLPTSTAVGCRATYITLWFPTQTSIAVGQDPRPMNTFFNTSTTLSNAGCGCKGGGGGGAKLEKLRGCPQDLEKIVDSEQTEFRFRQHDGSSHKRFIDLSWIVSEKLHDVKQCAWSSPCMWQPWQVWTQLDKNLMRKNAAWSFTFSQPWQIWTWDKNLMGKKLLEVSLFQHPSKIIKTGMKVEVQRTCMITQFNRCCSHSHQH